MILNKLEQLEERIKKLEEIIGLAGGENPINPDRLSDLENNRRSATKAQPESKPLVRDKAPAKTSSRRIGWTPEMIEWLKKNLEHYKTRILLTEAFNNRFNMKVNYAALWYIVKIKVLSHGNTTDNGKDLNTVENAENAESVGSVPNDADELRWEMPEDSKDIKAFIRLNRHRPKVQIKEKIKLIYGEDWPQGKINGCLALKYSEDAEIEEASEEANEEATKATESLQKTQYTSVHDLDPEVVKYVKHNRHMKARTLAHEITRTFGVIISAQQINGVRRHLGEPAHKESDEWQSNEEADSIEEALEGIDD